MRIEHLSILLIFGFSTVAHARQTDTSSYNIQHFTDENGLPQNSVKFIAPDKDGFLWLATENGLVRFEGNGFRNFTSNRISYIYPAAGRNGLLARADKGEVLRIKNGRVVSDGTRDDSLGYQFLIRHVSSGVFPVTGLPNLFASWTGFSKYVIAVGEQNYYTISSDSIAYFRNRKKEYGFSYPANSPWTFFTIGEQLYHMPQSGSFVTFQQGRQIPVRLNGNLAEGDMEIYWNYAAEQVFIYQKNKCYFLKKQADGSLGMQLVVSDFDFKRNNIISLYYDVRQERIFMGSQSKGLYIYTKKKFHAFTSPFDESNVYYAQAHFGNNGVVTPQGIAFDANGKAHHLPLMWGHAYQDKYSLVQDRQGNIWHKEGNRVNKYNSDVTRLLWSGTIGKMGINQMCLGADDRLWIGTTVEGIYFLDIREATPVTHFLTDKIQDASYLVEETKDILWAGTGKGLYRINIPQKRVDSIPGFKSRYVRSINIPVPGEVWVTTYDAGIFLYRNNRLTAMPNDRKQYLNTTHCMMLDEKGYFWITTNKGLFQAARKDMLAYAEGRQHYVYYLYYGKGNGFLTNEFNGGCQPCALRLQNGKISFPSLDGLLMFAPSSISPDLPDKPVLVDDGELDTHMLTVSDSISLPNNYLRFGLHLSTPYFGDPYNVQMFYSLEGGEHTSWLPVDENGVIYFSRMHSGTYRLHIRKINGFGTNNFTEKIVTFTVAAAWFETTWFRVLAVFILLALLFLYISLRTGHIRRKNRILKMHVSERTKELEETLDILKASEQQLRKQGLMQQRLITAITHDIKTPMKYLMLLANAAERTDKNAGAMHDALYRMYHLVDNLIQYMKMQAVEGYENLQYVDLHELLEEKAGIFRPIAETRAVQIYNRAEKDIHVPVNRQLLAVVINNLLDNAVKYTLTGSVSLATTHEKGNVRIHITDTGIGMQPEMREWINRNQAKLPEGEHMPFMQNGIGLMIVIELLQQINGILSVYPNGENGTKMEIVLHQN